MKRIITAVALGTLVMVVASTSSATRTDDTRAPACKRNGASCQASSECCGGWCISTPNSSSKMICSSHS